MSQKAILYNQQSSLDYGWKPRWFGVADFNEELIDNVKAFQMENGLTPDGMVGEITFRRIWTKRKEKEAHIHFKKNAGDKAIICDGVKMPIEWDNVVTYLDDPTLLPHHSAFKLCDKRRDPILFVNHWDATLSSNHCLRILNNRGLSVHFMIDNDGTILQSVDTNHITYHAGNHNSISIGVEITNAFYTKYQDWYVKNGYGKRPIKEGVTVHGKPLETHLGFYPVQLKALSALWAAISNAYNIPLEIPIINHGVDPMVRDKKFTGFCAHYHITSNKIDIAGVNLQTIKYDAIELNQS
tara:strand:- start:8323 stop:9213 length:891 start_codon:yes stop_codon:yes gene_type:complete